MFSRREFIKLSGLALAARAMAQHPPTAGRRALGVQLYTVRDLAEKDLPGTLKQIRTIGFDEVELYWSVYRHPAAELRRMIADAGLKAPSGHFDYEKLDTMWDYAGTLGLKHVVIPMLPQSLWTSADGYRQAAARLQKLGEQARSRGFTLSYHHHNYEFRRFGDQTVFDLLMANTDPKLVKIEMDCYWITQAGLDPVQTMEKYGRRIRMLHLKDRKRGVPTSYQLNEQAAHFTEVGRGSIRWKAVLAQAEKIGVEHLFVEQDESERSPLESIRISHDYLRPLLRA